MQWPVILVLGPVGCGKSTACDRLARAHPDVVRHIDGDTFLPPKVMRHMDEVMRATATVAAILGAACEGRIPVVSTGGGAVCHKSSAGTLYLTHAAHTVLGMDLDITLVIPDDLDAAYDNPTLRAAVAATSVADDDLVSSILGLEWRLQEVLVLSRANKRYATALAAQPHTTVVTYDANGHCNLYGITTAMMMPPPKPQLSGGIRWRQWFTLDAPFTVKPTMVEGVVSPTDCGLYSIPITSGGAAAIHTPGEAVTATAVFCYRNKRALCSFIVLLHTANKAYIVVDGGPFSPRVIGIIREQMLVYRSPLERIILDNSRTGRAEAFRIEFWTQPVVLRAHAVVPQFDDDDGPLSVGKK